MVSFRPLFYKFNVRKNPVLILFIMLHALPGVSQKDLARADKLYNENKYGEAVTLYDKMYEKKKDRKILLKLADANFMNENYAQAQKYYADYFHDSVYENIPQFVNYAKSSRLGGKMLLAATLYQKHFDILQDSSSKGMADIYKLYVDSAAFARSYDLDSNYNCITIDASESLDTMAAPIHYNWEFDDGKTEEGMKVEHCFGNDGLHKVVLNITDRKTELVRQRDTMLLIWLNPLPVKFAAPKTERRYFFVDFDATATDIPGYDILDYVWNMDNGELKSGQKIKYKFNESGNYRTKLIVIARDRSSGRHRLFSANKKIMIVESYEMPSKTFTDSINGNK